MNKIDIQRLDVEGLEKVSRVFFQTFGTQKLIGEQFFADPEGGSGKNLFEKLISKCGYENNTKGFFQTLVFLWKYPPL